MRLFGALRVCVGAAALLALSSCGGGSPAANAGIDLVGRGDRILSRSDSVLVSALHYGEQDDARGIQTVPVCAGDRCDVYVGGHLLVTIDRDYLRTSLRRYGEARPILTRNDITIAEANSGDFGILGSALRHSAFVSERSYIFDPRGGYYARSAVAVGDLAGSRPAVNGSWSGLMTGTLARNGNYLTGDANFAYAVSSTGGHLEAEFSNIRNKTRNSPHDASSARFADIAVDAGGAFDSGIRDSRIQGGFYGDGHAEVAGVFERSGILGAFGAYRRD